MSKSDYQHFHLRWKRVLSALLAALVVIGLFPVTAFAAEAEETPACAPTGDFELNVAGATGWNGTSLPLPVYASETGGDEMVTIPASDEAGPVPFVILGDNGGDRVQIGLVGDADGNVVAWEGSIVDGVGWVDKEYIFINLADVIPSIAYNLTNASGSVFTAASGTEIPDVTGKAFYPQAMQFNPRLGREEYIVPCMYTLAQRLAKAQKSAMSNGDTLVIYETFRPAEVQTAVRDGLRSLIASDGTVSADMKRAEALGYGESWFISSGTSYHQSGLAVDVSLAKGDASALREYEMNGTVYRKYESWTEYDMPSRMHELSSAAIRYKTPADSNSMPSNLENWTDSFAASEGAKRLQVYCTTAGLIPLSSEWWHFNDPNAAKISAKGKYSKDIAVNTRGGYTFDRVDSVTPQTALTILIPWAVTLDGPTGGTGGLNPGSAGGSKPGSNNVSWSTLNGRTFIRFTLIEFPKGVVTDLNNGDYSTWHTVGTPLNVMWGKDSGGTTYDGNYARSNIVWFNSNAMRYNSVGNNAPSLMAGSGVTGGVYSYDASAGHNQRWVMTADEFQADTGISDTEKDQMFNLSSDSWSTGWLNGDYTSMWGTDPQPVTPGNLYTVYTPNKAFLYLLNRLSERENSGTVTPGWSEDEAIANWSSFTQDDSGNLRTKYRIIVETGAIITDPDGNRRAYTLRDVMAYTLYNNEPNERYNLIYDQTPTEKNMAQWMRQAITQFVEYPLDATGQPTGEELFSTNGFTEADSFVDSISSVRDIRDKIFSERRSFGLHIFSPFNFVMPTPDTVILEVTKKTGAGLPDGGFWGFTVNYTAGSPTSFTAKKGDADCTGEVTDTGSGLKFTLAKDETIRIEFVADSSFRYEVSEDDPSNLTDITGAGGTADTAGNKFANDGSATATVTFTNDTTVTEKKPVYLKLKKVAKSDHSALSGAVFGVYADESCSGSPLATLTTGADGTAVVSVPDIVEDGESVTLYVKETTAPSGFTLSDTVYPVTARAPENSTEAGAVQIGSVDGIENDSIPSPKPVYLKLKKIAKSDGSPLSGAVFSVYADASCSGAVLATLTTGADGTAVTSVPDIVEDGGSVTLYVKETTAPSGFTPSDTVYPVTARAPENSTEAGAVQVGSASGIENGSTTTGGPDGPILYKRDALTNGGVGPATFKFSSVTNGVYEFTTDENGNLEPIQWWDPTEAEGRYIKPGEYAVTEIIPPPGYEPTSEVQQIKLELDADGNGIPAGPLVFKNLQKVGLRIVKYDRVTHTPMEGVTFEIYKDGLSIGRYETKANGEILLTDLEPGTYRVVEVDTGDEGHILDTSYQEIELAAGGGTKDLIFFNDEKPGMKLVKVDSDNPDKTIAGAVFEIKSVAGDYGPKEFTTDGNGEIDLSFLPEGSYVVTEKSCPGYIIDQAQRVIHLKPNDVVEFVFTNTKDPTLRLIKTSADGTPMAGVTFRIAKIEDGTHYLDRTTNAQGEIEIDGLEPGVYSVVETATLEDHILDTTEHHVELSPGKTSEIRLKNDRKPGLRLIKTSADGTPLDGVTFRISKVGDSSHYLDRTTENGGEIFVEDLEPGIYSVVETATLLDHILDETEYHVELFPNQTSEIRLSNDKKPGLRLIKTSADGTPLEGVTFRISKVGDSSHYLDRTTDENGEIFIEDLEPGIYSVVETATLLDHILDETEHHVELFPNQTSEIRLSNDKRPWLVISKTDKDTGEPVPGVTFTLRGADGPTITTKPTGEDGKVTITDLLPGVYTVTEQSVPENYIIDTTPQTVTLYPNRETQVEFQNHQRPTLKIAKVDINGRFLTGAIFEVKTKAGVKIGDFPVGPDGTITVPNIHLDEGYYIITEIQAPEGYILDPTPHEVYLRPGKTTEISIENKKKPGLTIYKIDSVVGDGVKGAKFKIYVAKDKDPNGTYQELDSSFYYTDDNGIIHLDKLDTGWYKIVEVEPPAGYMLKDPSEQIIYVENDTTVEVTFENIPKSALVIRKVDADTGAPLANAWFRVRYLGGTSGSGGTIIGEYCTSSNGNIIITGLDAGTYIIEEISAPNGYVIDTAPQTVYISGKEQDCITVTFTNSKYGSLLIKKVDSVTGEPLSDVQFFVTDSDGSVVGSGNGYFTTDSAGTILVSDIMPGTTLVVRETRTRPGYLLDDVPQTVKVESNRTMTLEFRNQPLGSLLIRKVCAVNPGTTLQDAEFKVMYSDGTLIGDSNGVYITDENGEIRIDGLTPGKSVVVTETRAPAGFLIDTQSQTVVIQSGKTVSLTFKNQPKGGIIVQKRDSITGQPLPGAQFRITTAAGCEVGLDGVIGDSTLTQNGIFTTDSNGEIRVSNLAPGTYVLTEIQAPAGYVMDSPSTNVVIGENGDTQTVIVTNTPKGGLIIEKYDSVTKQPLKDAEFKVTTANGELVADNEGLTSSNGLYTTDVNGQIVLSKLLPGTYIVTETRAPDNYQIDPKSQTVVVNAGDTQTLRFYDDPLCTLTILKRDAVTKKPLAGAEFQVRDSEGRTVGANNGIYTTGSDGTATVTGLTPNATIVVSEVRAPSGYILDETPKNIVVRTGVANSLIFDNQPGTTLIIHKYIEGTENEPLSGVAFKVVDGSGAAVGPDDGIYYTDKSGDIVLEGIEPGTTVIAREIKTVDGFVLDGTPQDILIKGGEVQQLTFWNKRAGTLVVVKKDSVTGGLISGAQFQLTYANGGYVDNDNGHLSSNGLYTTDANGEIRISGITGTVVVKEVQAASGYVIDNSTQTQTVTVNPMDTQTLTFLNDPLCSLVITKLDSVTGKPVPGTVFTVKDGNGNLLGTYTTGADGTVTVTGLVPGTTVVVTETKVPSGYVLNTTPQTIVVQNGTSSLVSGTGSSSTGTGWSGNGLVFENDPTMTLTIHKYIEGTANEPLAGVAFRIVDGSGAAVGSGDGVFYTDAAGKIVVEGLEPGTTVTAQEIKTVDGFVLDGSPKSVKITASETAPSLTFWNQRAGNLIIRKLDSITKEPLAGVEFKVTYADGTPVDTANGTISSNGVYVTDANGEIHISGIVGSIVITETKTIDGYTIDENERTRTITVNPGDTQTITVYNTPRTTLVIQKLVEGTETPLAGVEFLVTDDSGAPVGRDNGRFVTDKDGRITIEGLPSGTSITAKETKTVDGYILDTAPQTIKISEGTVQTLTFHNRKAGNLIIKKLDSITKKPLAGVEFRLTYTDGSFVDLGNTSSKGLYTTDSNGEIVISGIVGSIVVTETKTIPGYTIDENERSQTVQVNPDDTQTLTFYNLPVASLVIQKYITGTDNEPLAGVEFLVTDATGAGVGQNNGHHTTDKDGRIVIDGLTDGDVLTVKEVRTADGFLLDGMPQTVKVKSGEASTLTFWNERIGSILIKKMDASTKEPLSDVLFKITRPDGSVVGTANGEFRTDAQGIISVQVDPGTYLVQELQAKEGYLLDDTVKTIEVKDSKTYEVEFLNQPLGGLIIHKLDSETLEPLAGVQFKITYADGSFVDAEGGKLATNGLYTTDKAGQIRLSGIVGTLVITEEKTVDGYMIDELTRSQTVVVNTGSTSELTFYNQPTQTLIIEKLIEGTKDEPLAGVEFLITDSDGTLLGPSNGVYKTDKYGRIYLYGLEPGTVITAKETKTLEGFVLDSTPQSIEIRSGEVQYLTFYNTRVGGLELIKVSEADKTQRIPGVTFEIRKMDGGLIDTVTTGDNGRIYTDLDAGYYYLVEIEAPKEFKVDSTPHYFEVVDGKTTTVTVTNKPFSGILIHKTSSLTGKGIYGVTFLLYDSTNTPIGQYTSDNNGYVYIEGLTTSGRYFLREMENKGYIVDTEMKTVYVTAGETTLIEWKNTPITGQIQITKTSADYNSMNGWAAGTALPDVEFEIYDKANNLVDTIKTNANGIASSSPLPLGRYTVVESKAADFYGLDKTPMEAEIEFAGQIVRLSMTNKSLFTNVSITKRGYAQVMPGQSIRYDFSNIGNNSTVPLTSFYWRDTLPTQAVRLEKIITGTYNVQGNYKIVYKTNLSGDTYRTLADNLSTQQNHSLAASPAALGLASNECVTEFMFIFGTVPANFRQVEAPMVYCNVLSGLTNGTQFSNQADVGGIYNEQWIMATDRWVTTVYAPSTPLPRTGY